MGNATSSEEVEEQNLQGPTLAGEDPSASEENLLDFSSLFLPDNLYKALLAIKEPPGSAVSRNKDAMVRWLSGLADKDEHTVNMVQVVEHLTGKGVSKQEALEFFSEVDRDGEGQVDIAYLLMVLKDRAVDPMQALVPCHITPGPLEVYLPEKCGHSETSRTLVQFLQARRVEPSSLVVGCMSQILGHQLTKEKLVQGRYQMLLQREEDDSLLGVAEAGCDMTERVVVAKCYSKIETSTSQNQIRNLTDNRTDTHWQSNGSPRSHWIRLCMLPGMTVRELSVTVDSSDDSYMPRTIVVLVGNVEKQLQEIKTVHVPRDKTGPVVLVKNLGGVYHFVQINIRACHSDGCDVKIRGLHVKGSKMQEQKQPTVLDTLAVWYISLLASTAKAAIPVAPHLRDVIIAQSKSSLETLQPLILSPTSGARPEFLSSFVIQEMETMLKSLSLPDETYVSVSAECLEILLAFSIAHANVNSILDCLHILLDNQNVELKVKSLLLKMEDIKHTKRINHAEAVQLSVVSCSGGCKDEGHKPENMVNNDISDSSAAPYISAGSHRAVTVVLREKESQSFFPTRLVVQVPSASNAATCCLLFLLDQEPDKAWLEGLASYEGWGRKDYTQWQQETEGGDASGLIAMMEFSRERLQVDISPDTIKSGRSLVLLMSASSEEVEGVAVQVVSVFGHISTSEERQTTSFLQGLDTMAPLPLEEGGVVGGVVLCRVLVFLSVLLQDLSKLMQHRRLSSLDPSLISEPHLAVDGLSLEKIWNLYIPLTLTPDGQADYAALLALWLLQSALPFIKPEKKKDVNVQTSDTSDQKSSTILSHLCALLDAEEGEGELSAIQKFAQVIVVKGVVVFFPDATARKEYLLTMIGSVLNEKQPRSWWLKFEALCQYFSKTDANSLLSLPMKLKEGEVIETGQALDLMSTMLTVAMRESQMTLSSGRARPGDLVRLLSALQASLFFWCRKNMVASAAQRLLLSYLEKLVTVSTHVLKEITSLETDKEKTMELLEQSLLTRTLAEMLVFLPTIAESPMSRPHLMDVLYPLVPALQAATTSCPGAFLRLSDTVSLEGQTESVVCVWTRESSHNYENNARVSEEFVCPSATKFVVEFDLRCITERRYDYLEFTDITGAKHKFDGKVNSDRWPRTAEFPGQKLQFLFHSDGSNNEWGYLFTLKAYGQAAPSLHWLFDLQLSLARLLGQLASAGLSMKTMYTELPEQQSEEQREELLLTRSDLWKTLFRGGYRVGKLTRSLSGAHTASPADSKLNSFLHDLANGPDDRGKQLLDSLREKLKGQYYGGELVDQAVNAVFAALIWHCQDLREELTLSGPLTPSQLLQDAFSTAEALRRDLVESRQKMVEAKEKEENKEKRAEINEDSPLIACHEKAVFLLKFAGLSRVAHDGGEEGKEEVNGGPALWPRHPSSKWQKVSNAISTVGRLKQQLSLGGQTKPRKKPISFELVLSFVKNEAATVDKVHRLLQEREKLASCTARAYTSSATYLTALSIDNMFELPGLVFLQQLMSKQRHFPIHYAAKLDGCGLELENQVRKSYRLLLQQLLEGLAAFSKPLTIEYSRAHLLVSIITCHLLDFQWQEYDHRLLAELQLSDFLLQSAITTTQSEDKERVEKFEGEEAILTRYALHMSLIKELGDQDIHHLQQLELYQANKWEAELFVCAMACSSDKVAVQCDGCQAIVRSGTYYHNMELKSTSFDLCPQCFKSGSGSRPDDHSPHQLYHAMGRFTCDGCKLSIMSHRFHSNTRDNFDLCLGCFRKEEANSTKSWSLYLLTKVPSTDNTNPYVTSDPGPSKPVLYQDGCISRMGPALDLMVYQQQHCWLLFTALSLSMAHCLNSRHSAAPEQDYRSQASSNLLQCLRQLSFLLHTAVLAKWEEQARKAEAEERERERKKEEKIAQASQKGDNATPEQEGKKSEGEVPSGDDQPGTAPSSDDQPRNTAPSGDDQPGTAPSGDDQPGTAPSGDDQPRSTAPSGDDQPGTAPSGDDQPGTAPSGDDQPGTAPSGDDQPGTAPSGDDQPGTAPSGDDQPGTAPSGDDQPGTAPSGDDQPGTAPSGDDQPGTALDTQEKATPSLSSKPVAMETKTPPPADEDPITVASRLRCHGDTNASAKEKTFASLNISRALYTLAAVLPQDMSISAWQEKRGGEMETTLTEQVLPSLLEVATCTPIQPLIRRLAYLVAAQYMARVNPQVADHSIAIARNLSPDEAKVLSADGVGLVTAKYFFYLGADFLRRSDFSGAATIAECLLVLSRAAAWKEAISLSVLSPLSTKAEEMDLSSIFGLMVLAGFPKLHREGSLVRVHSSDSDSRHQPLSVLTSVEGECGNVISCKHREPQSVKLARCEVEDTLRGCITSSQLPSLLPLLRHSIQLAKLEDNRQVEATWILALSLKALLALMKGSESREAVQAVWKEGLLPDITRLASRATRLRQKWLASDLEVVAIQGYQPVEIGKKASGGKDERETEDATDGPNEDGKGQKEGAQEEGKKESSRKAEEACLEGLSDEIQDMLVIMQEAFQCPLTTLRALFDASGADVNQFIMSSEQYYDMDSATLKPPDDILEAATKWEVDVTSVQHEVRDIQDALEDTGVTRLVPVPFSPSSLEAEPEKVDIMKRPKSSSLMQEDGRLEEEEDEPDVSRQDSFQLLQEQLKESVISRKQLLKTQQAIVVLYARQVLASLLSHWPHPPLPLISTSLLGNMDVMQFFCLLDLLMKPLNRQARSNLLRALVDHSEPTQTVSLAVKAAECMRKVSVGMEKKQFHHQTQGRAHEEKGKVVIPNASSMSVVFHQTRGEVVFSSKEDFSDHHKTQSSSETNTQRHITHLIPGNTVHYRVALDAVKESKHPCCTLSITGTQMGRFSTGLQFLDHLLSQALEGGGPLTRCIPLAQLWPNLIAVACQHTGRERLKVIRLLLRMLAKMKEIAIQERPDLSALKPLWQFYTTLLKDYETKNKSQQLLAPEIVRALTELFLAVENQAEEWGVSQAMMIETLTKEGLGTWLEKGISNVAFLSLGLGLDNTASRAFIEAKRSYLPPVEEKGKEEEGGEGGSNDSSSSNDDSSLSSASESEDNSFSDCS